MMNARTAYIGLSCTGHDGALAVVENGKIRFAEAAERFYQNKFAVSQAPDDYHHARAILARHVDADELVVAKSWSRDATAIWHAQNRLLRQCAKDLPRHAALIEKLSAFHLDNWDSFMKPNIELAGSGLARAAAYAGKTIRETTAYDHHLCHAAFGAYGSPFESAAVAVMDGQGEGGGAAFWQYRDGALVAIEREPYTGTLVECYGSLGLYYGIMVCLSCGFEPMAGEEWKIMGLAPYGRTDEALYARLREFYRIDGLTVNCTDQTVDIFMELISNPQSHKHDFDRAANYAHTFQRFYSEIATTLLTELAHRTGERNLVISGGCGLNSSYNGRVNRLTPFERVYIPSAPADDGNAAGAAILAAREREAEGGYALGAFQSPYLGSGIDMAAFEALLSNSGCLSYARIEDEALLCRHVAERIAAGDVVAWVQGRAEFGPRALGNRSILADPRQIEMKDKVNRVVKFREGFRPFAPSVLAEHGEAYFLNYQHSPYMERTLEFRPEKQALVPAVCHADGTGRVQSVTAESNPLYHRLIEAFHVITGVPMVMNTSLNVMGKPIIHSAEDAIVTFLGTGMDCLVVGPYVLAKSSVAAATSRDADAAVSHRQDHLVLSAD